MKNLVLIGDTTPDFGVACATQLKKFAIDSVLVEKNLGMIYYEILTKMPNIIILDTLPREDKIISLVKSINSIKDYNPKIILIECNQNYGQLINQENLYLFDMYIDFSVNIYELCENIIKLIFRNPVSKIPKKSKEFDINALSDDVESGITELLMYCGIPGNLKGFQFLRYAILKSIVNPLMMISVSKKLYVDISETYDSTISKVERAIRHSIEVGWERGAIEELMDTLGYNVIKRSKKPTNTEFIAIVSDKLRLRYKNTLPLPSDDNEIECISKTDDNML